VLPRLGPRLRSRVRDDVLARRELTGIHSVVVQRPKIKVAAPRPADELRAHYRRAWRRFGVGPSLLAAVNLVESQFGRLRNESVSGAQGPMQFMPATWAAYGLGGNVRDPRDAILGAANYLHANGAPRDEARALYHYNPSRLYVSAVRRYARQMRRDDRAFYGYYAWQVFVRTKRGPRRVGGPVG
jgi:membrane-bound lytic murein transglycosylase B